jgi:hypothetical protein
MSRKKYKDARNSVQKVVCEPDFMREFEFCARNELGFENVRMTGKQEEANYFLSADHPPGMRRRRSQHFYEKHVIQPSELVETCQT